MKMLTSWTKREKKFDTVVREFEVSPQIFDTVVMGPINFDTGQKFEVGPIKFDTVVSKFEVCPTNI